MQLRPTDTSTYSNTWSREVRLLVALLYHNSCQAIYSSIGGDVNITDSDGDTPLYVVENVETARWLVEHGAIVNRRNSEGLTVRSDRLCACIQYTHQPI